MSGDGVPELSVIIATYNRRALLERLLHQLDAQTLAPERYEVVVVDDGSREHVPEALRGLKTRYALRLVRQENGGAAAARQRAIELAAGELLVIIDDDMQVPPQFLAEHLAALRRAPRTVVQGALRPSEQIAEMPLFERFFARMLARTEAEAGAGARTLRGRDLYTGNCALPRALFFEAGGFDASFRMMEDAELGVRLEKAGARFDFSSAAYAIYGSDKTSTEGWLDRSFRDGAFTLRIARKHPDAPSVNPFRFIAEVNPLSRPVLLLGAAAPALTAPLARAALGAVQRLDGLGLDAPSIAGATLVYGLQFFRGVGQELGGGAEVWREYRAFARDVAQLQRGQGSAYRELLDAIRTDHEMARRYQGRYDGRGAPQHGLARDAVEKIGFQVMVAYRLMRFFRASNLPLAARFTSRLIRHLYGSDLHWDAELEPGVVIVHGFGLAISYAARVRSGCILFQNVTLGYGRDAASGLSGAPVLEREVHVGVGATLFGPIRIGEGSKVMAGCTLSRSVPPRSIVEAPEAAVHPRARPAEPPRPSA